MVRRATAGPLSIATYLLVTVVIVATLYFARDVFVPLALSILLSLLLSPLVRVFERMRLGTVPSVVITGTLACSVLLGCIWLIGSEMTHIVRGLPQYRHELVTKARSISGLGSGMGKEIDQLAEQVKEAMDSEKAEIEEAEPENMADRLRAYADNLLRAPEEPVEPHDGSTPETPLYTVDLEGARSPLVSWAGSVGSVLGPIGTAGLVVVFTLFILVYRDDLRDRLIKVISRGDYVTTTEAIDEAAQRISRFLLAQLIVNTTYGITIGTGLFLIGRFMAPSGEFPNYALWGFLCILLRFLPYIGPIVAGAFPVIMSIAVFPGYGIFIATLSLIIAVELVSNNLMEPWLYGASTGISAIAVVFSAVFWGWLWGPVGLLLSTPLAVCLVVLGRHVRPFRIFATLLGDEIPLPDHIRLYQRLLAGDDDKAEAVVRDHEVAAGHLSALDEVVVPVVRRIRTDLDGELLDPQEAVRLLDSVDHLLVDRARGKTPIPNAETEASAPARGIAIPAHHRSEEIVLHALATVLPNDEIVLETTRYELIPLDTAEHASRANPDLIVIAVVPPGGFPQARFLCKKIRKCGYSGPLIVMCLGRFKNYNRLFMRFRRSGASYMTTTIEQTKRKIDSLSISQVPPVLKTDESVHSPIVLSGEPAGAESK